MRWLAATDIRIFIDIRMNKAYNIYVTFHPFIGWFFVTAR